MMMFEEVQETNIFQLIFVKDVAHLSLLAINQ